MTEPSLTLEMFRGAAGEILQAIAEHRKASDVDYRGQWMRLWSLLRLWKAAGPRLQLHDRGPWSLKAPDSAARADLGQWLVGGNLWLAVAIPLEPQPGDLQLASDLPKILNAAKVEPPDD